MSLDVYIKYKQLKKKTIKRGLDGVVIMLEEEDCSNFLVTII